PVSHPDAGKGALARRKRLASGYSEAAGHARATLCRWSRPRARVTAMPCSGRDRGPFSEVCRGPECGLSDDPPRSRGRRWRAVGDAWQPSISSLRAGTPAAAARAHRRGGDQLLARGDACLSAGTRPSARWAEPRRVPLPAASRTLLLEEHTSCGAPTGPYRSSWNFMQLSHRSCILSPMPDPSWRPDFELDADLEAASARVAALDARVEAALADPFAPPDQVQRLLEELRAAEAARDRLRSVALLARQQVHEAPSGPAAERQSHAGSRVSA